MRAIHADLSLPLTEFTKNPAAALEQANGRPLAVLMRGKPSFYAVPPGLFERLVNEADDVQLTRVARARLRAKTVVIDIDSL